MKFAALKLSPKPKRIDGSPFLYKDMVTLSADPLPPGEAYRRPDYPSIIEGLDCMLAASRDVIFVGSRTAVREVVKVIGRQRPAWIIVEASPSRLYLMETWGL